MVSGRTRLHANVDLRVCMSVVDNTIHVLHKLGWINLLGSIYLHVMAIYAVNLVAMAVDRLK